MISYSGNDYINFKNPFDWQMLHTINILIYLNELYSTVVKCLLDVRGVKGSIPYMIY